MPTFTIEASYRLPVYRHVTVEADTVEDACRMVLEDEDWDDGQHDYESAGATYISGAWRGERAYRLDSAVDVPATFQSAEGEAG
jgi:hypothetical protein